MKATNDGHCQICGLRHRLNPRNQKMVKHGYNVRWGCFNGICTGADNLPFELSKDLIEGAIFRAEMEIANLSAQIVELLDPNSERNAGTSAMFHVYHRAEGGRRGFSGYRWEPSEIGSKSYSLDSGRTFQTFHRIRGASERHPGTEAEDIYGAKTMKQAVMSANASYVKALLAVTIEQLQQFIAWQRKRIASWTVQPVLERAK